MLPASLRNHVTRAGLNSTGHFWELSWAHTGQDMPCTAASALASLGPGRISTRSLLRVLKKSLFATNCCSRDTPAMKQAARATTILLAVPEPTARREHPACPTMAGCNPAAQRALQHKALFLGPQCSPWRICFDGLLASHTSS